MKTITAEQIRAWAEANDVDGIESFAQSSSYAIVVLTMEDGSTKIVTEADILAAAERAGVQA